jgi:hypothetical protein
MNGQTSTKQLAKLTDELTVDELDIASGGTWLTGEPRCARVWRQHTDIPACGTHGRVHC